MVRLFGEVREGSYPDTEPPAPPGTQHLTCILTPQNNPTRAHSIALLQVTEVRAALHGREGFLLLIDNKSKICAAVQIESFFQLGLFCLKKNVM